MSHVFVSYARRDMPAIERLTARLNAAGHEVWIDRSAIEGGDLWRARIVEAIEQADALVVALSPASVASPHVRRELEIAQEREAPVVPVAIEPVDDLGELKYHLSGVQRIDLARDFDTGVVNLLEALRNIAHRAQVSSRRLLDPALGARLNAILADPTEQKVERCMYAVQEHSAKHPSPRRRKQNEIADRCDKIGRELQVASERRKDLLSEKARLTAAGHFDGEVARLLRRELDELYARDAMLAREQRHLMEEQMREIEKFGKEMREEASRVQEDGDELIRRIFKA
jgi:hypothetical protein